MRGRPGILRHRVTIEANTPTASDYGENADSWSALETVYADVKPVSDAETFRAGMAVGTVSHRITMRYREDIGANDVTMAERYRFVYDSRSFEIVGVTESDRRRYLEIMAREVL